MNLKEDIREIEKGNLKVFDELDNQIEELKLKKYILGVKNVIRTVEMIHKNNKIEDLCGNIFVSYNGSGEYYFSSDVYVSNSSNHLLVEKTNVFDKKTVMKFGNELNEALHRLFPEEKWMGELINESVTIDFSHKDCNKLEEWFLSDKVLPIYNNAKLDSELKEAKPQPPRKLKV